MKTTTSEPIDLDIEITDSVTTSEGARIIIDPFTSPKSITEARAFAENGGCLIVFQHAEDDLAPSLTGANIAEQLPESEWFVTLAKRAKSARLQAETPIRSRLLTLSPVNPSTVVAATTSVRFTHAPVIVERPLGKGRVISCGIANNQAALSHSTLGKFLKRLALIPIKPSTSDLGVAIVGYGPLGGMGYTHGLACTETEGLKLVAALDTSPERLEAARKDFPELRTYGTPTEVGADSGVDVAIIATPPIHHASVAIELLNTGKHVVVEKPMAITNADAKAMIKAAEANNRTLTVHQSRRWDRDFLALKQAISSGSMGEVFNIETFVGGFEHPCRAWHSEETVSGGAVYDWGSHHIDWIIALYGEAPNRVINSSHKRVWHDVTNVDQLSVWMQWQDGREATFRQSDISAIRRPKFFVQGTNATLQGFYRPLRTERIEPGRGFVDEVAHHAEAPVDFSLVKYKSDQGLTSEQLPPAPHPGWGFHQNLADHILLGEPLAVLPEQSMQVVNVLEAAHLSGKKGGQLIEVNP